jgi:hypothetical protein
VLQVFKYNLLPLKIIRGEKMKKTVLTFLIVFVLAVSPFLVLPTVNSIPTFQTWAFISITPNPIGLGQSAHIRLFLQPFPPTGSDVFHGFGYVIVKPDGTQVTAGPVASDTNGAYDFTFTPTAVGTYTIQFSYPGETFPSNFTALACQTSLSLVVQQEQVTVWPDQPLPTGYWTRPISSEFRSWSSISGDWLTGGCTASGRIYGDASGTNKYTQAPLSPHVMWTKAVNYGGLIGGAFGSNNYYTGLQYNALVTPPIVIDGRLYYRTSYSSSGNKGSVPGFTCVDLRSGEEYWSNSTGNIDFGQVYITPGFNGNGANAFLYDASTTTWIIYNAWTGTPLFTLTSAVAGPAKVIYGDIGDAYVLFTGGNTSQPWLAMWNSTKAFAAYGILAGNSQPGSIRPATYNWTLGLQYNVTTASVAPFTLSQWSQSNTPADQSTHTVMLVATPRDAPNNGSAMQSGYDALTGQLLWGPTRTDYLGTYTNRIATGDGMYVQLNAATMQRTGINMLTGQKMWDSDAAQAPWGQYTGFGTVAYGLAFAGGYDGYERAFNLTTGKLVWKFSSGNSGLETPYGTWPMFNGPVVGGGALFCGYSEHTPNSPVYRGAQLYALDAMTGTELWHLNGWMSLRALADGYLVTVNMYDGQIYTIGKGPSKTTITGPQTGIVQGSSAMLIGSVTDQSPGQPDTPAISDASMGAWMEYLHMQKVFPTNATGVPVTITATDSAGVTTTIGQVTSDINGKFGFQWTPPTAGTYKIIATFAGSNSYGGSSDATYIAVDSAPSPAITATPAPTVAPTVTQAPTITVSASPTVAPTPGTGISTETLLIAGAAVVIIVAVVAAAVVLRRRK